MGQATIFAGQKIKTLKSTLSLNGGADIISSTTNPQSSAVSAEPGSLLLNTTSGIMYRKLDAGSTTNWVEVGSGAGTKNYIKNPDFDGGATTGWAMRKVSLSSLIPTGNIGAADAGHTIATSSSNPLEGANSLLVQGASLFTAGNCLVSDAFAIDRQDQAKVMGWSFYFEAITSNMDFPGTSAGTWAVYIAEVTTATPDTVVSWIQPAGVYNLTQGSGVGLASGTFQTTASGTAYRLVLVCINSEAAATTLKVDDFQLGPQKVVYGSPVTDWQPYTISVTANTTNPTLGTVLGNTAYYRRVGDSLQIRWAFRQTSGGTAGSGDYLFSLPPGFAIDTSKTTLQGASVPNTFGVATISNSTPSAVYTVGVRNGFPDKFILMDLSANIWFSGGTYNFSNANLAIGVEAQFPIAGLSSSVQMSNDTDTRVVAAKVAKSGVQVIGGAGIVKLTGFTSVSDTSSLWDSTNNRFNVSVSGIYQISLSMNINVAQVVAPAYRVNGVATSYYMGGDASGNRFVGYSTHKLNAGDFVEFYPYINGATNIQAGEDNTYATITRVSGPATIAASESVQAKYWASASGTTNTLTPVNFDSKVYDSHNAVTTGAAWKFTAPVSGKYQVNVFLNSSAVPSNNVYIVVYKNASASESISYMTISPGANTAAGIVEMNAGQFIDIRTDANWPWFGNASRAGNVCLISISRVGN